MGELLQAGGYEENVAGNGRMAAQENPGYLLETVEEDKDKVQDDPEVQPAGLERT